jgi:hypothetical protein
MKQTPFISSIVQGGAKVAGWLDGGFSIARN